MLNAGVIAFSSGRLTTAAPSGTIYFNGGTPVSAAGALAIEDAAVVGYVGGLPFTAAGALAVSADAAVTGYGPGGLALSSGKVAVSSAGAVVGFVGGLPVDTLGRLCVSSAPSAGDQYYANVSLLLHMNGANGASVFTDNGPLPKTITPTAGATTSTAQSVFNGSSGLFNGTTGALNCGSGASYDFGSGDFTIEGAIRPASVAAIQILLTNRESGGADPGFFFYLAAGGVLTFAAWNPAGTTAVNFNSGANVFTAGAWQWFAVRRQSSTFTLWKNAVQIGSTTYAGAISNSGRPTLFGQDPSAGGRFITGHAAEVRVTKGIARTIVVPTSPWPNSAATLDMFNQGFSAGFP